MLWQASISLICLLFYLMVYVSPVILIDGYRGNKMKTLTVILLFGSEKQLLIFFFFVFNLLEVNS